MNLEHITPQAHETKVEEKKQNSLERAGSKLASAIEETEKEHVILSDLRKKMTLLDGESLHKQLVDGLSTLKRFKYEPQGTEAFADSLFKDGTLNEELVAIELKNLENFKAKWERDLETLTEKEFKPAAAMREAIKKASEQAAETMRMRNQ